MTLQEINAQLIEINNLYQSGQISAPEYKSLLEGLEISQVVCETAEEMAFKEDLNKVINHAINALSLIA
jgi:hypothetical protein